MDKKGQRNGEKLERTRICRNLSTISGQRRTSGSAQLDLLYHIKASILIVLVVANFDRYYDYNQIVQKSLVWGEIMLNLNFTGQSWGREN
jgi:hypothetical protein